MKFWRYIHTTWRRTHFNEHNIVQLCPHVRAYLVCYGQITEDEMFSYMEKEGCELFLWRNTATKFLCRMTAGFTASTFTALASLRGRSYYPVEVPWSAGWEKRRDHA